MIYDGSGLTKTRELSICCWQLYSGSTGSSEASSIIWGEVSGSRHKKTTIFGREFKEIKWWNRKISNDWKHNEFDTNFAEHYDASERKK